LFVGWNTIWEICLLQQSQSYYDSIMVTYVDYNTSWILNKVYCVITHLVQLLMPQLLCTSAAVMQRLNNGTALG